MSTRAATPLHSCPRMALTVLLLLPMLLATRPIGLQPRSSVLRRMPMFYGKRASPASTSLPPSLSSSWRQPAARPLSPPPLPPPRSPHGWEILSRLVNEVDMTSGLSRAGVSGSEIRSVRRQENTPSISEARKLSPEFYRKVHQLFLERRPSGNAAHYRPHDAARPGTLSAERKDRPHSGPSGDEPVEKERALLLQVTEDAQDPDQPEERHGQLDKAAESRRLQTRLEALARIMSLPFYRIHHAPSSSGAGDHGTTAPLSLFLHTVAQDPASKPLSRHFDVPFGDARDRTRQGTSVAGIDSMFTKAGYLRPTALTI